MWPHTLTDRRVSYITVMSALIGMARHTDKSHRDVMFTRGVNAL